MKKITLIGFGRLGSHLFRALAGHGIKVTQIFARSTPEREALASEHQVPLISDPKELKKHDGLYILAVPDSAIDSAAAVLAQNLEGMDALVTHTSGNTSLDVLKKYFSRTGLFYPLQSFSTGSEVVWDNLPVFIQADNEPDMEWLHEIGRGIGGNTISIREDQRSYLHMAAVIANNFPNALFNWAKQILDSNDLAFEYLHPLILDGLKKSLLLGPDKAQTGPAQRGDSNTVRQHLDMLGSEPEKRALYKALSLLINPDLKINEE